MVLLILGNKKLHGRNNISSRRMTKGQFGKLPISLWFHLLFSFMYGWAIFHQREGIWHSVARLPVGQQDFWRGFNTLRPRQNGCHFTDNIFKCIFFNENFWILNEISLKYVPYGLIDNLEALVQIRVWCQMAASHYLEQCWYVLLIHVCITGPHWVKDCFFAVDIDLQAEIQT